MRLKDLQIGAQLQIGFGIISLMIILLGGIAWQQTDQLAQKTDEMYHQPLPIRVAMVNLESNIVKMRLATRDLMLADNIREKKIAKNEMETAKKEALLQFDILKNKHLSAKSEIKEAYNAFISWNNAREENLRLINLGEYDKVKESVRNTGKVGMLREQMIQKIKKVDSLSKTNAQSLYKNSILLHKELKTNLIVLVISILLTSFAIIFFLIRNFRRPLNDLNDVATRFHKGDMDVRSKVDSKNEFGVLSKTFNTMLESIQLNESMMEKAAALAQSMLTEEDAHKFFQNLLPTLSTLTNSQMAAVYLLSEDKKHYEHFESIGITDSATRSFEANNFEGEFGSVLISRKIQSINSIPFDTRFIFQTVSGKFIPREIITIPIIAGDEIVAIISLASVRKYSSQAMLLINYIFDNLSARVEGVLTYQKMKEFSNKLEVQNNELEVQKKELSLQADELTKQNIELEIQKKQLNKANRMKTIFLSNMSHELRTPLNSVIALSGVLNRRLAGKVPEEEHSYLDVIERNGKQLLSLINDILDLSRIEAGREEMEIVRFNMNGLIQEIVEMINPQAVQKNINLKFNADTNLPLMNSDYEKCQHILQNIIANAIKFTEKGSVEIHTTVENNSITITVTDTGIGIDNKQLSHIFDEFRQADGSNSRKYGGTGLGLAIAKKYAILLGGSITVESSPNKGSIFTICLPAKSDQQNYQHFDSEYRTSSYSETPGVTTSLNKTILVVEDTEAIIIQLKDILESEGYSIMVANDGNDVFDQIKKKVPDAMILDLMMPGVDGFEVLERIRADRRTDQLPVIILTAKYVTSEELALLKHHHIHQLIRKGDVNKEKLLEAVAHMMQKKSDKDNTLPTQEFRLDGNPQKKVVLVVEDNPDNMLTIKALLTDKFTIIEAEDGKTGLELAHRYQPNLIFLDIALPVMNGIEVLKEIRNDITLQNIPVLAVTAAALKGDKEEILNYGFNDYISKPIDHNRFERVISEWMG